jgi:hypothetical protein
MREDGGPVFPQTHENWPEGIALRDWFAGTCDAILSGIVFPDNDTMAKYIGIDAMPSEFLDRIGVVMYVVAKMRYQCADAMLAEREKEA